LTIDTLPEVAWPLAPLNFPLAIASLARVRFEKLSIDKARIMDVTDLINFDNVMFKLHTEKRMFAVTINEDKRIKTGIKFKEKIN
jgi:hypothetical protein